jgi:cell division septum initiation protein DivIVA
MSLIINNKQLLDTIESLERRINKHEEAILKIKNAVKNKLNAEEINKIIKEIYK